MKLKDWEINELFSPFAEGTAEENYEQTINSAKKGSVYMAASLLQAAGRYISEGEKMPEPLSNYIAKVLNEVSNKALEVPKKSDAPKRAREIVQALYLKSDHRKRNSTEQEKHRLHMAQMAQIYMTKRIACDGLTKYEASKEAANKFPDAVKSISKTNDEIDLGRIKAYSILYDRSPESCETFIKAIPYLTGIISEVKNA